MAKPIRIQKVLSDGGILSLRKTEEYIRAGKITVNGHKATLGNPVFPTDVIAIDGERVVLAKKKENVYIMLNKPRGYVTTTSDELGRKCITELVADVGTRVYPVGRLDKDSEGLLLLTNDGQFANLVMHPSHHIGKTYRVTIRPGITEEQLITLSTGVDIGEGEKSGPATVLVQEKYPDRAVIQVTISEGKNREVRRMCEGVGLEVARLKRISEGPVRLAMLQPGKWRDLKKSEVIALKNAAKPAGEQEAMPGYEPKTTVGSFGSGERRGVKHAPAPRSQLRSGRTGDGIQRDKYGACRFSDTEEKPRRGGGYKSAPKPEYKSGPKTGYQGNTPKPEYKSGPKTGYQGNTPKPGYKPAAKTGYQGNTPKPEYKSGPKTGYQGSGSKPEYKSGPKTGYQGSAPKPEYKSGPKTGYQGSGSKPEYKSGPKTGYQGNGSKPEYKSGPKTGYQGNGSKPGYKPASKTGYSSSGPKYSKKG